MPKKLEILPGARFGRLTVVRELDRVHTSGGQSKRVFLLFCDCGKETTARIETLVRGCTRSCGCFHSERIIDRNLKHGMSETRMYKTWANMIQRCTNPRVTHYKSYGGRGIKVCERWMNFDNFYEDTKEIYNDNLTIDRINVDGDYEPSNIRWITNQENCLNKRNTVKTEYEGKERTLKEVAELTGIKYDTIHGRVTQGKDVHYERAQRHEFRGQMLTLREISTLLNEPYERIEKRHQEGRALDGSGSRRGAHVVERAKRYDVEGTPMTIREVSERFKKSYASVATYGWDGTLDAKIARWLDEEEIIL